MNMNITTLIKNVKELTPSSILEEWITDIADCGVAAGLRDAVGFTFHQVVSLDNGHCEQCYFKSTEKDAIKPAKSMFRDIVMKANENPVEGYTGVTIEHDAGAVVSTVKLGWYKGDPLSREYPHVDKVNLIEFMNAQKKFYDVCGQMVALIIMGLSQKLKDTARENGAFKAAEEAVRPDVMIVVLKVIMAHNGNTRHLRVPASIDIGHTIKEIVNMKFDGEDMVAFNKQWLEKQHALKNMGFCQAQNDDMELLFGMMYAMAVGFSSEAYNVAMNRDLHRNLLTNFKWDHILEQASGWRSNIEIGQSMKRYNMLYKANNIGNASNASVAEDTKIMAAKSGRTFTCFHCKLEGHKVYECPTASEEVKNDFRKAADEKRSNYAARKAEKTQITK